MKYSLKAAVIACAMMVPATQAIATTINFEDLVVGATLSNQYAGIGAIFSANAFSGPGTSTSGEAWATNTDMTIVSSTGTDVGGLGTPSLVSGNILRSFAGWLGEDGDPSFAINFAGGISNFSATFAGVSTGADVSIYAYNGATLLGTVNGAGTGQFVLSFAAANITKVAVRPGSFNDWVGVDNITYTPNAVGGAVPEPESWALMLVGFGAMGVAVRRARRVTVSYA
jgi:PEP-CTERM motif